MVKNAIDVLKIVPSHLETLLATTSGQAALPQRFLILGGEVLSWKLIRQLKQTQANCMVINHYGPTEMTIGALVNPLGIISAIEDEGSRTVSVPIGYPLANTYAYILDEDQQIVPPGVIGELYLGGPGLAAGYLHQEEQTRERFVVNPFVGQETTDQLLYKTGDMAYRGLDGQIVFVGRVDNQVKIRGYRIELGEIESILARHTNIRASTVRLLKMEQEEVQLVAYIIPWEQPAPSHKELHQFLQDHLPTYMLPSVYVPLRVLPLTTNGKIDYRQLPLPEKRAEGEEKSLVEPRSFIEEMLVEIWKEVLPVKRLGIYEDFTSLGGHSLLATQIISRMRTTLQVDLPLKYLFEAPTIAGLAVHVEQALHKERGVSILPIIPVSRDQVLPLSFAQQRLWFLDQLEPDSSTYNIPYAVRMKGHLNVAMLRKSLWEIMQRHESLRTTFHFVEGQVVQVINTGERHRWDYADLSLISLDEREHEAVYLAEEEAKRPFNLTQGPLLRTQLLRLDNQDHVLLLTMHHIVSDGWSSGILIRELNILYTAFTNNQPSPLSPLTIQYVDFAAWQQKWLQGEILDAHLNYWLHQLAEASPLDLLTDHPRPRVQTSHGAREMFILPVSLCEQLKQLSQREGVTLFMTLLAAFQVLLARYSGQTDISVGTSIANRTREEIEGLIGFFVNTLVLRTDLSGNPGFTEILKRVREVALSAYAHQDVPFEKIVEELQLERDLSRSPLFQVFFELQHAAPPVAQLSGLTLLSLGTKNTTAKFDLSVSLLKTEQAFAGSIEYNTDLFEAPTIQRLLQQWQTVLEGIVAQPEQTLAELPLMTQEERLALLTSGNQTQKAYPLQSTYPQQFAAQAARTPDAVALVYQEQVLTYQQVQSRVTHLAQQLRQQGVGPEVLVGLYLERSLDLALSMLATWKAGGVCAAGSWHPPRAAGLFSGRCARVCAGQATAGTRGAVHVCHGRAHALRWGLAGAGGERVGGPAEQESSGATGVCDLYLRVDRTAQRRHGDAGRHAESPVGQARGSGFARGRSRGADGGGQL